MSKKDDQEDSTPVKEEEPPFDMPGQGTLVDFVLSKFEMSGTDPSSLCDFVGLAEFVRARREARRAARLEAFRKNVQMVKEASQKLREQVERREPLNLVDLHNYVAILDDCCAQCQNLLDEFTNDKKPASGA